MYVCLCRGVTSSTVTAVIVAGAATVEEVGDRCAAGTVCGKCRQTIAILLAESRAGDRRPPGYEGGAR